MATYDEIIAQATGAPPAYAVPSINTGTPLIPETNLRDVLGQALLPQQQPQVSNRDAALLKIGSAMLAPRQPGQSPIGQISQAVSGGVEGFQQAQQRDQQLALQKAQVASAIQTQDTQRRQIEANMQIMAVKFPVEFAKLQQELADAQARGDIQRVEQIKAKLMLADGGAAIVEEFKQAQKKSRLAGEQAEAALAKTKAESDKLIAEATQLIPAHAEAYRGLNKPDQFRVIDKDQGLVALLTPGGGLVTFKVTPGMGALEAKARAKRELQEETGSGFLGFGGPSEAAINERAARHMQGSMVEIGKTGPQTPSGTQPQSALPANVPSSDAAAFAAAKAGGTGTVNRQITPAEEARMTRQPAAEEPAAAFVRDDKGRVVPNKKQPTGPTTTTKPGATGLTTYGPLTPWELVEEQVRKGDKAAIDYAANRLATGPGIVGKAPPRSLVLYMKQKGLLNPSIRGER